jgi:hypothetical protein
MPTVAETIAKIVGTDSWDQRIAEIRLIPQHHGTAEHQKIHAEIARQLYVPHLAPDFAYINEAEFYGQPYFEKCYAVAETATSGFKKVSETDLAALLHREPQTLLAFRTIMGLTKAEFAYSTELAATPVGLEALSPNKVDSMERMGTATSLDQARIAAITLSKIIDGDLFGTPPKGLLSKQAKLDTKQGWTSVRRLASDGVPFSLFLHQRHYGGAFRQLLDATSTLRGNLMEDAVESLFKQNGVPYIRTGTGNQPAIVARFQIHVTPAPDFVVFDGSGQLRGMLECKGANDGGTARDKANRFETLRAESVRLGGIPLIAVLGGIGWARVNDALGPVIRDTEGRVFSIATLSTMLQVQPFSSLVGLRP